MPISLVQRGSEGRQAGVSSVTSVFSANPAVGSKIIVTVAMWNSVAGVTGSVADNYSNTYTQRSFIANTDNGRLEIWEADVTTTGATFTVTLTASLSSSEMNCVALEYSGVGSFDLQATNNVAAGGTSISVGPTANLANDESLAVTLATELGNSNAAYQAPSTFTTIIIQNDSSTVYSYGSAYQITQSAVPLNPTWTMTNQTDRACILAVFSRGPATYNVSITENIGAIYETLGLYGATLGQPWQPNAFGIFPQATGGTIFNVSISESIGTIAETITNTAVFQVSLSEPIGTIAESQSNTGTFGHSISEAVGTIAETQSAQASFASSLTENIGTIAESAQGAATYQVTISEPIGTIAETVASGSVYSVTISESIGTIAETQTGPAVFASSVTENVGSIAESQSNTGSFNHSVSESIGTVAETQTSQAVFSSAVSEAVGTIAETQTGPATFQSAVTEGVGTIAETQGAQASFSSSVSESIGSIADAVAVAGGSVFNVTITESMGVITDTTNATGGGGSTSFYELGGDTVTEKYLPAETLQQPDYLLKKTRGT